MWRTAIVVVLLAAAVSASHAHAVEFGFNDNAVAQGIIDESGDARLLADVGAGVHRTTFNWRFAELSPKRYSFGLYDRIYAADLSRGVRPLLILMYSPDWTWRRGIRCARDEQCLYPPSRRGFGALARVAKRLVRRYPEMAAIELWNEPNLEAFWHSGPDPEHYAKMLGVVDRAVRRAGSDIPVLAGSLSNAPDVADIPGLSPAEYLRRMYEAGARGSFDGLSIHPYPHGRDLAPMYRMLTETLDLRARFRDRTPVWVTEIGETTTAWVSPDEQAVYLTYLTETLSARREIAAVLLHTLMEPPFGDTFETGFGIVRQDGSVKPAYCALARQRMRVPSGCLFSLFEPATDPALPARWEAQATLQRVIEAASRHARRNGGTLDRFATGDEGVTAETAPGPSADPARVGVFHFGSRSAPATILCNASRAETSYCALYSRGRWVYGHAQGSVGAAAAATISGSSSGW